MFYKGIILNSAKFVNAIIDACISSICIFLLISIINKSYVIVLQAQYPS